MQPDPLSPPQEEKPSEPLPAQEVGTPEPFTVVEGTPVEVVPVEEIVKVEPAPMQAKTPAKRNTAALLLGIFAFILLVAVAGLGYWAFTLNNQLTTTQGQLAALQGDHSKLQADYAALTGDKEKLTSDLTQTRADLEKANADLATAQADLKKSQDQNTALTAKIDKASKLANILYKWFTSSGTANDIFDIDSQIKATGDSQLKTMWTNLTMSPSEAGFGDFILYLVTALRNGLK